MVNGPGEAKGADLGIAAGRKRGHLFVRGQVVKVVPENEMVDALLDWAQKIASDGIEGALAAGDRSAEAEAQADRVALIELQGEDVNHVEQTVAMIRKR